jgi:hypothetical protein
MKFEWNKEETWTAEFWLARATVKKYDHRWYCYIEREGDCKKLFEFLADSPEGGMAACEAEAKKWLRKTMGILRGDTEKKEGEVVISVSGERGLTVIRCEGTTFELEQVDPIDNGGCYSRRLIDGETVGLAFYRTYSDAYDVAVKFLAKNRPYSFEKEQD